MTENRNDERYSEIIRNYYDGKYDKDTAQHIRAKFAHWFFNEKNLTGKEQIIEELLNVENGDSNVMSADEVRNFAEQIIQYKCGAKHQSRVSLRRVLTRVAAVVIPLMVLVGAWVMFAEKPDKELFAAEFSVPYGETERHVLGDSTKVAVNAGSRLAVKQTKKERVVELTGESYFSVTKDAERPFVVKTNELTVTVLGTEFNVEAYPNRDVTVVTLNSGKVAISTVDNKNYTLLPNQQFVYSKSTREGNVKTLEQPEAIATTEWQGGVLVLDELTLNEALKKIERRFNIKAENSSGLNNLLYGKFPADATLDEVMSRISLGIPELSYTINGGVLTIRKK